MAYLHQDQYDALLQSVIDNSNKIYVCSAEPANYAGLAAVTLGSKTITSADFTGPLAGLVNGRRIAVNEITGVSITVSGVGLCIALADVGEGKLRLTVPMAPKSYEAGEIITIESFNFHTREITVG